VIGSGRLGPLAHRDFRLLFLGRGISFFGNAMATVALAFAVLEVTGSKSDLGLVIAVRSLPQVAFILVGGVWADRLPRHVVMVASNTLSGATQTILAVLLITHHAHLPALFALAAANGASTAFFFPASAGIVPQTVDASMIQQANVLLRLALNITYIGGAAAAGFVVQGFGPGWAIAVDGASFYLAALFILRMRLPAGLRLEGSTMIADLRAGWQEFRSRTWLWAIVAQFSIVNAAETGSLNVLGPVISKEHLGGAKAWGAILTCQTAGLLLGGLVMLRARPQRLLLAASFGVFALAFPLVLLGIPAPLLAIAAGALAAGLGIEIFSVLWDTSMQQHVPREKLSRVYSYDALGSWVLVPAAFAVVGPVSDAVGSRATLFGAATLVLAATLAVLAIPDVRNLRRKDGATA
jgi:MFS family permease